MAKNRHKYSIIILLFVIVYQRFVVVINFLYIHYKSQSTHTAREQSTMIQYIRMSRYAVRYDKFRYGINVSYRCLLYKILIYPSEREGYTKI